MPPTTKTFDEVSVRRRGHIAQLILCASLLALSSAAHAAFCPRPLSLGPSPTRLVVVVPATGQGPAQWESFLTALKKEPQSNTVAWLFIDHGIQFTSLGSAYQFATELASCIDEKVKASGYRNITIIGHSIGGMIARRAYLEAAGAFPGRAPPQNSWVDRVDTILLLASVNKGIPPKATWWSIPANWLLRTFPHPRFVLEDLALGSDFIADVRIAWIRHFGFLYKRLRESPQPAPPRVVQFWGRDDSIVTEADNADIEAFSSGPVIVKISGAKHGDLNRLEEHFAPDPAGRWALFRDHLLKDVQPIRNPPTYQPQRVLFIARGIRDSSNSEWVSDLRRRAIQTYGEGNVEDIEYGYFSAAHFALRPLRAKNIPRFRDLYAERLAKNPLTVFDFIGHSNGTYIFGQSLLSTPSMRFRNVVLAAPVLPTDFDWSRVFLWRQVEAVRYDAASWDWPVGILCPVLRALGFTDVGPSGVVLFGEGTMTDSRVRKVGWYDGDHGASLRVDSERGIDNRQHLLNFAVSGSDLSAGEELHTELGAMLQISRATPYVIWTLLGLVIIWLVRVYQMKRRFSLKSVALLLGIFLGIYVVLDVV